MVRRICCLRWPDLMRLLITRPLEDSRDLAADLKRRGLEVCIEPLLEIRPRGDQNIPGRSYQALLVTSANGARALVAHPQARFLFGLPVYAVGEASAEACRAGGFTRVMVADGDLSSLLDLVQMRSMPARGPLLYVSGSVVSGDLAGMLAGAGFEVVRVVLYDAIARRSLSPTVVSLVEAGDIEGVLLFSPRTARIWAEMIEAAGLAGKAASITHFCLSETVAAALRESPGLSLVKTAIATTPSTKAIIDLILNALGGASRSG